MILEWPLKRKFSVYLESPNKLYLPRFYGIKQFGDPTINKLKEPEPIRVPFNGELREEQNPYLKK